MKKLVLYFFLLVYSIGLHAEGGIYEYYLNISGSWYGNNNNPSLNGAIVGTNLNLNTDVLNIGTRGINTWNNNGCNVTAGNINYRVYRQWSSPTSFIQESLSYQGGSGNDKYWNNVNPAINLLTGLTEEGTYIFEVYFDAPTNGIGGCPAVLYENNGGGNFVATFTVATALPVKYVNVKVSSTESNKNQISWTTLSEINNDYFEVQHSTDGVNFDLIGMVAGNGNTNQENNYTFVHKSPTQHLDYYRLKQVDYDGNYEYSPIVSLFRKSNIDVNIYPNPTQGVLNITGIDEKSIVTIYEFSGKVIRSFENIPFVSIDIQDLNTGIYLVSILNNQTAQYFKIVKE